MSDLLIPELYCTDLQSSFAFYVDLLGFTVDYQREEEGFVMLAREGAKIMLEEIKADARKWLTAPLERPFGRGINLQIKVSDVDALYARVESSHATIFLALEEKTYRVDDSSIISKQFIVQDPDGYLLRFWSKM